MAEEEKKKIEMLEVLGSVSVRICYVHLCWFSLLLMLTESCFTYLDHFKFGTVFLNNNNDRLTAFDPGQPG